MTDSASTKPTPSAEQMAMIQGIAQGMKSPQRAPILKTPADYGLDFEDVFFPSFDGVALEAWYIPAANSDKLIICNHPLTMNRYGFPGHMEPWSQFADIHVEFINIYKALNKAGYNVLTYDMRNHGRSADGNGGIVGTGLLEWRDVVGAMQYVQSHAQLKDMTVGLYNPCAGGNAAMVAITKQPEFFTDVKAFVCAQPCSMACSRQTVMDMMGIGDFMDEVDMEQIKLGSFANHEMSPHPYAPNVHMPTFVIQVREDIWTKPSDVQTTFDLLPNKGKKLFWVEGTTKRFDGYNYFGKNPEQMVEYFDRFMK